jgi:hypothetical protein
MPTFANRQPLGWLSVVEDVFHRFNSHSAESPHRFHPIKIPGSQRRDPSNAEASTLIQASAGVFQRSNST